jgi:hypothetical protein
MLAQSLASFALATLRYTPSGPYRADSPAATAESARVIPDGTAKAAHSLPSVPIAKVSTVTIRGTRKWHLDFFYACWSARWLRSIPVFR